VILKNVAIKQTVSTSIHPPSSAITLQITIVIPTKKKPSFTEHVQNNMRQLGSDCTISEIQTEYMQ